MRTVATLALLLTLVVLASPMPKNCRGRGCRHLRPTHTTGRNRAPQVVPGNKLPSGTVRRPAAKRPPVQVAKPTVTTPPTVPEVEQVTEMKMVTDSDGKEVREAGVNGWLDEPTPAPENTSLASSRSDPPVKNDKQGSCDTPKGFGIKCMDRFDQCSADGDCPGMTKCCMVGECGYLCVKPKPVSTMTKEVTKEVPNKKIKGEKLNSQTPIDLSPVPSEMSEAIELPEGAVKEEDIIELPEEIKTKTKEEQEKKKGDEDVKKQELVEVQRPEEKKDVKEELKDTTEEETISEEEKVVEEFKEIIKEEVALIEKELESTTQLPQEAEE